MHETPVDSSSYLEAMAIPRAQRSRYEPVYPLRSAFSNIAVYATVESGQTAPETTVLPLLYFKGDAPERTRVGIAILPVGLTLSEHLGTREVVMCIGDYLIEQRIDFERLPHPPAYSAHKRAKYLGMPGKQIAKSVLLAGPTGYLLAVLPATHQVDTKALAEQLGGPVRLANVGEAARMFGDCEWGVVPAFGTPYGIGTVLDDAIDPDAQIVLETHTQFEAVRLCCRDFERLENPRRLRFARRIPM